MCWVDLLDILMLGSSLLDFDGFSKCRFVMFFSGCISVDKVVSVEWVLGIDYLTIPTNEPSH